MMHLQVSLNAVALFGEVYYFWVLKTRLCCRRWSPKKTNLSFRLYRRLAPFPRGHGPCRPLLQQQLRPVGPVRQLLALLTLQRQCQ